GSAFRDSTKFFMPLMLFGGILIGISIEEIGKKFKLVYLLSFIFILFLAWQVLVGRLNGTLNLKNPNLTDFKKINELIIKDNGFFRDAWFNEISPFAYHTDEKQ